MSFRIVIVLQQNDEFIAAYSVNRAMLEDIAYDRRRAADKLIAGFMLLCVVRLFKSVDVTQYKREIRLLSVEDQLVDVPFRLGESVFIFDAGQGIPAGVML